MISWRSNEIVRKERLTIEPFKKLFTDLSIYGPCAENPGPFRPDIRAEMLERFGSNRLRSPELSPASQQQQRRGQDYEMGVGGTGSTEVEAESGSGSRSGCIHWLLPSLSGSSHGYRVEISIDLYAYS